MKNLKKVKEHFKFELTNKFDNGLAYYIYEDATVDGYSIWIATDDIKDLIVNEHVHYYTSELCDALIDYIKSIPLSKEKKETIYIDNINASFVNEAIEVLNELI